jgi:hypothetical protein
MTGKTQNPLKGIGEYIKDSRLTNPPEEWRESVKVLTAISLAGGLWIFLGCLAYSQFQESKVFAYKLMGTNPTDKDAIALIDKASDKVNNTANSLYALLTPLATAVTGYFFVASSKKNPQSSNTSASGSG